MVSCTIMAPIAPDKSAVSLPQQLIEQTVSLVGYREPMFGIGEGKWNTYCTGVWIDPITILTAYHCSAAAKVMSLPEDEQDDASALGNKLETVGAPIHYAVKGSFSGTLHSAALEHFNAVVVYGDADHDLSLIQVVGKSPLHQFTYIAEKTPSIGDEIEIMGHPAGIEFTFAKGYVSAYRTGIEAGLLDIKGSFMQMNIGISGGNSGGGVFDTNGGLVGIISFSSPRANVQGFAIHLDSIKKMLNDFKKAPFTK